MSDRGPWGTEDFDAMSWHDVHVHGFRLVRFDEEAGTADLVLDIDYILEWRNSDTGILFTVCQAALRFHHVFGLKFELDYAAPTAGMCPFSMGGIAREALIAANGRLSYCWHIPLNWPQGMLEFEAPSFTQTLVGEPQVRPEQFLAPEKRKGWIDA